MLNFYTAKQGEKLEERVAAVEQGGGGGSSLPELEIDCTGLEFTPNLAQGEITLMNAIYNEATEQETRPIADFLEANIDWNKDQYKIILKNITINNFAGFTVNIDRYLMNADITKLNIGGFNGHQLVGGRTTSIYMDGTLTMLPTHIAYSTSGVLNIAIQIIAG